MQGLAVWVHIQITYLTITKYILKWAYVDGYQIIDLAMTQSTEGPKNISSISEKITVIDCD